MTRRLSPMVGADMSKVNYGQLDGEIMIKSHKLISCNTLFGGRTFAYNTIMIIDIYMSSNKMAHFIQYIIFILLIIIQIRVYLHWTLISRSTFDHIPTKLCVGLY